MSHTFLLPGAGAPTLMLLILDLPGGPHLVTAQLKVGDVLLASGQARTESRREVSLQPPRAGGYFDWLDLDFPGATFHVPRPVGDRIAAILSDAGVLFTDLRPAPDAGPVMRQVRSRRPG